MFVGILRGKDEEDKDRREKIVQVKERERMKVRAEEKAFVVGSSKRGK